MTIDLDAPIATPARPPARGRWVAVAVALAAVAALIAVYVGGRPPPSEVPPSHDFTGRLRWIASLVDAAPRGSVAADPAFVRDLAERIEKLARSVSFGGSTSRSPQPRRARVLFAEDLDSWRVALVALQRPSVTDPVRRYALTDLLWLINARGATVESLASPVAPPNTSPDAEDRIEPVTPFPVAAVGDPVNPVLVALAPPSCQVATAPAADVTGWQPDPAGSYLVRRPWSDGPEYWRVTCDGVVREERPAPRAALSEQDLVTVPDTADRERVGYQVAELTSVYGSRLLSVPSAVYSGSIAFSATADDARDLWYQGDEADLSRPAAYPIEAKVTVVSAPSARGGYLGSVWATLHEGPDTVHFGDSRTFFSHEDPAADHSLLAVRIDRWRGQILVLPPESASVVQLLAPDGRVLDESPVAETPVMLSPGVERSEALRVRAFFPSGRSAIAELAATEIGPDIILAWEQD